MCVCVCVCERERERERERVTHVVRVALVVVGWLVAGGVCVRECMSGCARRVLTQIARAGNHEAKTKNRKTDCAHWGQKAKLLLQGEREREGLMEGGTNGGTKGGSLP